MLRRLDKKIRFRGHRRDGSPDAAESPGSSDSEGGDRVPAWPHARDPEDPPDPQMKTDIQDFQKSESERFMEVKGHLEIALLEKHFLQEEVRRLREEAGEEVLKQEVEKERCKRLDLEAKIKHLLKSRSEDPPLIPKATPPQPMLQRRETMFCRLQRFSSLLLQLLLHQPEEEAPDPEEPLSGKRLTENMRRLKRGLKPISSCRRSLSAISSWSSVYTSALAFIMYMNAAWYGWLLPLFLFLAIVRLSLNYLIARGWPIHWSILPEVPEPPEPPKDDLTVSEKFQLVLHVAQRAQNLFGKMSDILEKIKNLFMWAEPQLTQKLYVGLWLAFLCSCLLPSQLLAFTIGLYAGVKFFIINFLFARCPQLRDTYDTPFIIWTSLPTDLQLRERPPPPATWTPSSAAHGSLATSLPLGVARGEDGGRSYSSKKGAFHDVFNLEETERPLAVCENGWRCCLINRDRKTPTDYIRNGVLYVTENFLCFESSSSSKKNKVISLVDIIDIQKYKVLSVLPGSGMGISIATPSTQKPLVFGAMVHRDEAFEAIFSQYSKMSAVTPDP